MQTTIGIPNIFLAKLKGESAQYTREFLAVNIKNKLLLYNWNKIVNYFYVYFVCEFLVIRSLSINSSYDTAIY